MVVIVNDACSGTLVASGEAVDQLTDGRRTAGYRGTPLPARGCGTSGRAERADLVTRCLRDVDPAPIARMDGVVLPARYSRRPCRRRATRAADHVAATPRSSTREWVSHRSGAARPGSVGWLDLWG